MTAIAPMRVVSLWNDIPYSCEVVTEYPFRDGYEVIIKSERPVTMELELRIPDFAKTAKVDGKPVETGKPHRVLLRDEALRHVSLEFTFEARYEERPGDMVCVLRGPLLYALPVKERWEAREFVRNGVPRKAPYCDYELFPMSKWNYAYMEGELLVEFHPVGELPFSPEHAPIRIRTHMYEIDWKLNGGMCTREPEGRIPLSEPVKMVLVPYGGTNLRMTEMPLIAPGQEHALAFRL